jgi:hypothetical protein
MKLVKKDSIEYNFLKSFPNSSRKSSTFSETLKQSFLKFLHQFMRYVWTPEFLYDWIIIHQRIYLHYPTFLLGKQGIVKIEIITCLCELYEFVNNYLLHGLKYDGDETNNHCTIFNVPFQKDNQFRDKNPDFFLNFLNYLLILFSLLKPFFKKFLLLQTILLYSLIN